MFVNKLVNGFFFFFLVFVVVVVKVPFFGLLWLNCKWVLFSFSFGNGVC